MTPAQGWTPTVLFTVISLPVVPSEYSTDPQDCPYQATICRPKKIAVEPSLSGTLPAGLPRLVM
jgi:hypothetical protein